MMITLRITADGRVQGLWNDTLGLPQLGPVRVRRVSYVEFDHRRQEWCVRPARPQRWWRRLVQLLLHRPCGEVLHRAATREGALEWERDHLAPFHPERGSTAAGQRYGRIVWRPPGAGPCH